MHRSCRLFLAIAASLAVLVRFDDARAGIVALAASPDGRSQQAFPAGRAASDTCTEAEDLPGPACGTAMASCLDANTLGVCLRKGFLFRLAACTHATQNAHQGHSFEWMVNGSLPPSLSLVAPPSASTAPQSTSTAYVGGDTTIAPEPGVHDGLHFGALTQPYCGTFTVHASDLCPTTASHFACQAGFPVVLRTMDVPDPDFPLPQVTTAGLPDGHLDQAYATQILAVGGTGNYIFTIGAGALPNGLSLDSDGTLHGKASETGVFPFTVHVAEDPADPIFTNPGACSQAPACAPEGDDADLELTVLDTVPSTTTTLPSCPFPSEQCSQPLSVHESQPKASDCLYILRAAVGSAACCNCPCDVDSSKTITASDALRCLRKAVGLSQSIQCDECPA